MKNSVYNQGGYMYISTKTLDTPSLICRILYILVLTISSFNDFFQYYLFKRFQTRNGENEFFAFLLTKTFLCWF